jgi:histidinol-phosphate aminotransferase
MYPEYARDTRTAFVSVPRRDDFTIDARLVVGAVERYLPVLIMIANPNNPTGTRIPIDTIAEICHTVDCLVVVDEAYQEFTEYPEDSALALLPECPRLIVARTMSKAFAFAGGRLGYLVAAPAIVDACRIVRLPYHLSATTQAVARTALANAPELLARVSVLRAQIQALQRWLRGRGFTVPVSEANFCLFGPLDDPHAVWQGLLDRGVLIREVGPRGFLRVSAGTPDEMAAFRTALDEVLAADSGRKQ